MGDLPDITIEAINVGKRLARSSIGYGTITDFYDKDGEETHDVSTAVTAIVEWVAGGFSPIVLDEFNKDMD